MRICASMRANTMTSRRCNKFIQCHKYRKLHSYPCICDLGTDSEHQEDCTPRLLPHEGKTPHDLLRFPIVEIRRLQCAVKGTEPQREINPPGNWIAPPGSNRSGGGDNKAAGASGVEGRIRRLGESAGCNTSERQVGLETDNA